MSDIVKRMRGFESDHTPDGWPAIRMREVSELCDRVEAAETLIEKMYVALTQAKECCYCHKVTDEAVAAYEEWKK